MSKKRFLSIQGSFAAAHFYRQNQWDYEKNKAVFGKCFTSFGHGHEYRVRLNFDVSKIKDMRDFQLQAQVALQKVLNVFDHTHLNFDFTIFADRNPTTENIVIAVKEVCQGLLNPTLVASLADVMIFENESIGARP